MSNNSAQLFLNLISVFEVDQNGVSLLADFNTAGQDIGTAKTRRGRDEVFQDIRLPVLGCEALVPHITISASLLLVLATQIETKTDCFSLFYTKASFS